MQILGNLILFVVKTVALLLSITIDMLLLSRFTGRNPDFNYNGVLRGFAVLFLISAAVYIVIT